MAQRIGGVDDPRIAEYRGVSEPDLVRRRGLFIAEGRLIVSRLILDGRCRVHSVLVSPVAHAALEPDLHALDADVPILIAETDVISAIAGFHIHRGCLALAERPRALTLPQVLDAATTLVVLEGVTDDDNVGGVFRNAAAFGVDGVLLSAACCDPLYRKAVRTSMGAVLRVPFTRLAAWPADLEQIRDAGFTLAALTPQPPALSLAAFLASGRPRKLAWLVGTEGAGLRDAALARCDVRVSIPIDPAVDSLNLAVATGIALARLSEASVSDKT
jgi:tRNA G18 (ribose-2'-O)-methylase SpoU